MSLIVLESWHLNESFSLIGRWKSAQGSPAMTFHGIGLWPCTGVSCIGLQDLVLMRSMCQYLSVHSRTKWTCTPREWQSKGDTDIQLNCKPLLKLEGYEFRGYWDLFQSPTLWDNYIYLVTPTSSKQELKLQRWSGETIKLCHNIVLMSPAVKLLDCC